jgi:O-antigen/teichoic acid export membrane protein
MTAPTEHESRGVRMAALIGMRDVGRALRDFATYLPGQAIPAIAGFLVLPILARKLAPTDLGILTLAQTLVTLGWTAIGSWLTQVIVRELPAARAHERVRAFDLTLRRAIGLSACAYVVFVAVLGTGAMLSDAIASNLALIAGATAAMTIQNIAVSIYAASFRPVSFAIVDVLARTGGIAAGVTLVFMGYGVAGYLLGLAVASATVGVVGLYTAWPIATDTSAPEPATLSKWVRYGVPSSIAGLVLWGLFFIDRYLLAVFKSAREVGIYSVGSVIGDKAVALPTLAFFTAAAPLLVAAYERHGTREVERLMREYTRVILLLGLPILAFLVASSGILVPALAGVRYYHQAARVAPLVGAGSLLYSLALVSNTGLVIAKKTRPLATSAAVGLSVNVIANLLLIPPFGLVGSAIATPIGMAAYLGALQFAARRYARWQFPIATLARAVAAALVATTAAVVVARHFDSGPVQVVTIALLGGVLYIGILAALGEHRAVAAPILERYENRPAR